MICAPNVVERANVDKPWSAGQAANPGDALNALQQVPLDAR
jgi:hypothetical protein